MKRTALALTFIAAITLSVIAGSQLSLTKANVFPFEPNNPIIIIESPTNSTYNVTSLTLNVTIKTVKTLFEGTDPAQNTTRVVTYSLDGESPKVITEISYDYNTSLGSINVTFTGLAVLPDLSDGAHNITVHAEYDYNPYGIHRESESTVHFIIETRPPFPNTLVTASIISVACRRWFDIILQETQTIDKGWSLRVLCDTLCFYTLTVKKYTLY